VDPYIGITGFTKPEEVVVALDVFPHCDRKLMVGVLASWKSLRGFTMKSKWGKRTPPAENISGLFIDDDRAVNLVHISTKEETLLADMLYIRQIAGPNFHGFQLNSTWPETQVINRYRVGEKRPSRVVLQIGQKAFDTVGNTPQGVVDALRQYVGIVDDILLDPSGGQGEPFNTERAREYLSAIAEQGWNFGLGVAGGLGSDSLDLVEPLIAEFPDINIDAEGRLRNEEQDLDLNLVKAYIAGATQLFT
jgi:hypothetical protein